jgi:hypothetical protein
MDTTLPTASILYNYDTDRDAFPGLVIAKGGSGAGEHDPTKYQAWRTPAFGASLVIQGSVTVKLWSAMKDFDGTEGGAVTVYLRDFDGSHYVELGSDTLTDSTWQDGTPSWVLKTFQFSVGPHTVAPGHSLEVKVIVENSSDDDMWFAYDTAARKSRIDVPN